MTHFIPDAEKELEELGTNVVKLSKHIGTVEFYSRSDVVQELLKEQLEAMQKYHKALSSRIAICKLPTIT